MARTEVIRAASCAIYLAPADLSDPRHVRRRPRRGRASRAERRAGRCRRPRDGREALVTAQVEAHDVRPFAGLLQVAVAPASPTSDPEDRSNQGICRALWLSPKTVETHIRGAFAKLGIREAPEDNRRVLAVLAYLGR